MSLWQDTHHSGIWCELIVFHILPIIKTDDKFLFDKNSPSGLQWCELIVNSYLYPLLKQSTCDKNSPSGSDVSQIVFHILPII